MDDHRSSNDFHPPHSVKLSWPSLINSQLTRSTTFDELLEALHNVWEAARIKRDFSLSRPLVSFHSRCCPHKLQPWVEFPSLRQQIFDQFYGVLRSSQVSRLFNFIIHASLRCRENIEDLELLHRTIVENPVKGILLAVSLHQPNLALDIIRFEKYVNASSDLDAAETLISLSGRTTQPARADRFCVLRRADGSSRPLFPIEYRAPHELSLEVLRTGLHEMDMRTDLIDRAIDLRRPLEPTDRAQLLVATTLTQSFMSMLDVGVHYSCITTGEAFVFLHIKAHDPPTLHYHLAIPSEETPVAQGGILPHMTAAAQLLSFTLLASQPERDGEQRRRMYVKQLTHSSALYKMHGWRHRSCPKGRTPDHSLSPPANRRSSARPDSTSRRRIIEGKGHRRYVKIEPKGLQYCTRGIPAKVQSTQ